MDSSYSVLLIFSGVTRVVVPSFYAMKNTWLPAVLGALSLLVHLGLCQFTIEEYGEWFSWIDGGFRHVQCGDFIDLFPFMIGPICTNKC